MTTRQRLPRILFAMTVLFATSCGNDTTTDDGAGDRGEPNSVEDVGDGGTLVVGLETDVTTLLPSMSRDSNPGRAIFDALAARGPDGQVHPLLAKSIEPSDDLTAWTVTLRSGVELHDGTPLDAALMKRIFDEYLSAEGAVTSGLVRDVVAVEVEDELAYTYVLEAPNAAFPDILTGPVGWPFSIEACEAAGGVEGECGASPVGAGPFRFVSWSRDSELVLERNPSYWRSELEGTQLPRLDGLVFKPIPDEISRFQSVLAGDIHVGQTLRQQTVRRAREDDSLQSYESIGNNGSVVVLNTLRPPLDDVRVRLSLAHAVDADEVIDVVDGTGITPRQTQFYSPDSPWYSSSVAEAYPRFDPARGAELLAEYISDPNRSDGRAPGDPASFAFSCIPEPILLDVAQVYLSSWQDVGFDVELETRDQAMHVESVYGTADQDPAFSGDFDAACFRMGSDADPYVALRPALADPDTSPQNLTNYSSETIDRWLSELGRVYDFDSRYEVSESIMFELAEQVPMIWIAGTATSMYASLQVQGLDSWSIPLEDGETVPGTGARGALVHWSEVSLNS